MTPSPSASPRLALSAVIATHRRPELLARALESLCHQTLPAREFEVVVVDDGSGDATPEVVRGFAARLPVRYSFQRNAGLASARNHGLLLARGDIALFLDDDDLAEPRLLESHLRAHQRHPEPRMAVLGHTRLAPELADDPLMHFLTEVGCYLFAYPRLSPGVALDFAHFWGGRSSCKRAFLLEHGVFDPVFRFGCEDIELGFRLSRHGFQVVYEPEAVSVMIRGFDVDGFCRRVERQGRSNWIFSRLHPEKAVQEWTQVEGAPERWGRLGPGYEGLLRSARELDRLARLERAAGAPMAPDERELLHRAYHLAFRTSLARGIAAQAGEEAAPPAGGPAPARPELWRFLRGIPAVHGGGRVTYSLADETLRFIEGAVGPGARTLETGAGTSTLLFAYKGTNHVCVTPSADEVERLSAYCRASGVALDRTRFLVDFSQNALPRLQREVFDLVLIDGGHGFPVPFLDWYFLAPRLRVGGLLVVDDTQLWTGEVLRDFLLAEPEWRLEVAFPRGAAFRKVADKVFKEWNEQPYVRKRSEIPAGG